MARKLFLPLSPTEGARSAEGALTVDAMRARLGGRAATEPGAGEIVALRNEQGALRLGVVLFARGDERDVWLESGLVRRTRHDVLEPGGAAGADLLAVADDARIFATLAEGQRVRWQRDGGVDEGRLVEKCRFGALVERTDGVVLGVGFRRLVPAGDPSTN